MARDLFYMFGDVEPFVKIVGQIFVKKTNNSGQKAIITTDFNEEIMLTKMKPMLKSLILLFLFSCLGYRPLTPY